MIDKQDARDVIFTIRWKEILSIYVKVVFEKKDLTEPKVKQTTGKEDFEIVNFENGLGGTRINVKFVDVEAAEGLRKESDHRALEMRRSSKSSTSSGSSSLLPFLLVLSCLPFFFFFFLSFDSK